MATYNITKDHDQIRDWIESHDGSPALDDSGPGRGSLAINFGDDREFEPISWEEFFDHFESMNLAFQFDTDQSEADGFSYSFIDRTIVPSETDGNNDMDMPVEDLPAENLYPSASDHDEDFDDDEDEDEELLEESEDSEFGF